MKLVAVKSVGGTKTERLAQTIWFNSLNLGPIGVTQFFSSLQAPKKVELPILIDLSRSIEVIAIWGMISDLTYLQGRLERYRFDHQISLLAQWRMMFD